MAWSSTSTWKIEKERKNSVRCQQYILQLAQTKQLHQLVSNSWLRLRWGFCVTSFLPSVFFTLIIQIFLNKNLEIYRTYILVCAWVRKCTMAHDTSVIHKSKTRDEIRRVILNKTCIFFFFFYLSVQQRMCQTFLIIFLTTTVWLIIFLIGSSGRISWIKAFMLRWICAHRSAAAAAARRSSCAAAALQVKHSVTEL